MKKENCLGFDTSLYIYFHLWQLEARIVASLYIVSTTTCILIQLSQYLVASEGSLHHSFDVSLRKNHIIALSIQ